MVKAPVAGRVKTRLGRDIGTIPATWWFRHQVARLLRDVTDPRWDTVLAIAPDTARHARFWPPHLPRLPQGQGDLGTRMSRLLRHPHAGPVCLIGGDIPGLKAPHVARAFRALGRAAFTFGPAIDGGFWLVGLRHPGLAPAGLFRGVTWSTPNTLQESLATLKGHSVRLVDTLADVDRGTDL